MGTSIVIVQQLWILRQKTHRIFYRNGMTLHDVHVLYPQTICLSRKCKAAFKGLKKGWETSETRWAMLSDAQVPKMSNRQHCLTCLFLTMLIPNPRPSHPELFLCGSSFMRCEELKRRLKVFPFPQNVPMCFVGQAFSSQGGCDRLESQQ